MKKILTLLLAVCLLFALALPCFASHTVSRRLNDGAGLLNASDAEEIAEQLDAISAKWDMDVAVVTVYSLGGKSAADYADDYYDDPENGFNYDGVLLLIGMQTRDYYISTSGYGMTAFTDAGLEYLCERVEECLRDGDYDEAIETFADLCDDYIKQAKSGRAYDTGNMPKEPFDLVKNLLISIGIGLFIGLIVAFGMKSALRTERRQWGAARYVDEKGLKVTHASDIYLFSTLTRVRRQENDSPGGSRMHTSSSGRGYGGRGHGGRGGKF